MYSKKRGQKTKNTKKHSEIKGYQLGKNFSLVEIEQLKQVNKKATIFYGWLLFY